MLFDETLTVMQSCHHSVVHVREQGARIERGTREMGLKVGEARGGKREHRPYGIE